MSTSTLKKRSSGLSQAIKTAKNAKLGSTKKDLTVDEATAILNETSTMNSASVKFVYFNFGVYIFATLSCAIYQLNNSSETEYFRSNTSQFYLYNAVAFSLGIVFAMIGFFSSTNPEKRNLSLVLLLVDIVSFTSYVLMAFQLTPSLDGGILGQPVEPARYLEWIATCPSLILIINELTKSESDVVSAILSDYTLVIFGFFGAILPYPYCEWCHYVALFCFAHVVKSLYTFFTDAIEGRNGCSIDPTTLKVIRFSTLFTWTAFPVTTFLFHGDAISFQMYEALLCLADVGAKVFLTLVLMNTTIEQAQNERVEEITAIAQDLEEKMTNADKILNLMMPEDVLQAMKEGKSTEAEEFESVTVFFSDIANYTVLSSRNTPKEMMKTLNLLWQEYDKIAKKWGVYKVETIGDAFLGVCGCPTKSADHAEKAVNFSLDIMEMIRTFKTSFGESINIRVGLNSGPVTAGILGELNPHWCLVGDTVNTASRMESTSKAGHIHISEDTYRLIASKGFICDEMEPMQVKGKGIMKTYWVMGRK
eukprot:NODE_27_length_39007_cov_1.590650.p8 type:complete len:535 gc:universal NODE_27_length_39007_cov_1.590650:18044-16440(-)